MPKITLLYAAIGTFIYIFLSIFVMMGRFKFKVSVGDGGSEGMLRRVRMHANAAEYLPLYIIMSLVIEISSGSALFLHVVGIAFMAGRVFHPFGIAKKKAPNLPRFLGINLTIWTLLAMAVYAFQLSINLL